MTAYVPWKITGPTAGLVKNREEFLLPDDAYPVLQNAYVWRERIKRKQGCELLGRLQRNFTAVSIGNSPASTLWSSAPDSIFSLVTPAITDTNKEIIPGSVILTDGTDTFTDQGNGILIRTPGNTTNNSINYINGRFILNRSVAGANPFTASFSYAPGYPVMGCRVREDNNSQTNESVFFDQVYAYNFNTTINSFEEFLPGTTWTGSNSQFFWTTNYWIDKDNFKIFWATNNKDPIRYTNGQPATNWIDFAPQINLAGTLLVNALIMIPFRGRMVAFNVSEGNINPGRPFTNRIRWAAIGTPFTTVNAIVTAVNVNAWRDDIRGQGGFLDIPTSEDIVAVGFVRDNLVIYCETSTWQLRYTGRSIAPFQIEKVNSELGALSTFSIVQFDTSLVGFGSRGIVECDSYKSNLIDIKIPDLVFEYQYENEGPTRVQAIRDFQKRLAYWTFPSVPSDSDLTGGIFPDQRLVYNYENDSWALFNDSYTALGTYQEQSSRTWLNTHIPWIRANFSWIDNPFQTPICVGGNQQGFIEKLDQETTNDISLSITGIFSDNIAPTVITVVNHNLSTGTIIEIYNIPTQVPDYTALNFLPTIPYNNVFSVIVIDPNRLQLMKYNPASDQYDLAQLDPSAIYPGGGKIAIRDNFYIQSKKFNFIDEGQSIQLGYLDILMDSSGNDGDDTAGAISLNVYLDYNDNETSNTLPNNSDSFFNVSIPTSQSSLSTTGGNKFWQRAFCNTRANFLTLVYTFSNSQMAGVSQSNNVQIDAQVIWIRKGGRLTQI